MQLNKILVSVCGERTDDEILRLAGRIARRSKAKVYVVYVIQVKRSLPLDADMESETRKGEEVLDHAERVAQEQDYEIETELLQARDIGPAIVDEAVERGVDLLIIGLNYKKPFGQFSLGETIPYILKNALSRVMVYREPMSEGIR